MAQEGHEELVRVAKEILVAYGYRNWAAMAIEFCEKTGYVSKRDGAVFTAGGFHNWCRKFGLITKPRKLRGPRKKKTGEGAALNASASLFDGSVSPGHVHAEPMSPSEPVEAEIVAAEEDTEVPDISHLEVPEIAKITDLGNAYLYDRQEVVPSQYYAKACGIATRPVNRLLKKLTADGRIKTGEAYWLDYKTAQTWAASQRGFDLSDQDMSKGLWLLTLEGAFKVSNHLKNAKSKAIAALEAKLAGQKAREAVAGQRMKHAELADLKAIAIRQEQAITRLEASNTRIENAIERMATSFAHSVDKLVVALREQHGIVLNKVIPTVKPPEDCASISDVRREMLHGVSRANISWYCNGSPGVTKVLWYRVIDRVVNGVNYTEEESWRRCDLEAHIGEFYRSLNFVDAKTQHLEFFHQDANWSKRSIGTIHIALHPRRGSQVTEMDVMRELQMFLQKWLPHHPEYTVVNNVPVLKAKPMVVVPGE